MARVVRTTIFLLCVLVLPASVIAQSVAVSEFAVGRAAMQKDDFDSAIPAFEAAVNGDENNATYHFWLGNAYASKASTGNIFAKMKYGSKIRVEWERAVALNPNYYEAHANLYEFYTRAPAIAGGSAEKAQAERETMFRLRPYTAALQFANVDMQAKRYDAIVASLTPLLHSYPDSVAVPAAIAAAQADAKRYTDAWSTLDAGRQRFSDSPEFQYSVGRTAAISGMRLPEGAAALARYLATRTTANASANANAKTLLTGAHYRLGMIFELEGDKGRAREEYAAALGVDPKFAPARAALKRVGS